MFKRVVNDGSHCKMHFPPRLDSFLLSDSLYLFYFCPLALMKHINDWSPPPPINMLRFPANSANCSFPGVFLELDPVATMLRWLGEIFSNCC